MRYALKQLSEWKREYDIGADATVEDLLEFMDKWECLAIEQQDKLRRRNMQIKDLKAQVETDVERAKRYQAGYEAGIAYAKKILHRAGINPNDLVDLER